MRFFTKKRLRPAATHTTHFFTKKTLAASLAHEKTVFAEYLRKLPGFDKSHVKVKRFAIGCIYNHTEVDLVFAQGIEKDRPETITESLAGNVAAQNASRVLKIALNHTASPLRPVTQGGSGRLASFRSWDRS